MAIGINSSYNERSWDNLFDKLLKTKESIYQTVGYSGYHAHISDCTKCYWKIEDRQVYFGDTADEVECYGYDISTSREHPVAIYKGKEYTMIIVSSGEHVFFSNCNYV